jgi:hypothetical protein
MKLPPNQSLQPTPVGVGSSAFAVHVIGPAWLSLGVRAAFAPLQWTAPHTESRRAEPMRFAEPHSLILLLRWRARTLTLRSVFAPYLSSRRFRSRRDTAAARTPTFSRLSFRLPQSWRLWRHWALPRLAQLRQTALPHARLHILPRFWILGCDTSFSWMRHTRPNHALQRTRRGRRGCNRCVPCAGSLSSGR